MTTAVQFGGLGSWIVENLEGKTGKYIGAIVSAIGDDYSPFKKMIKPSEKLAEVKAKGKVLYEDFAVKFQIKSEFQKENIKRRTNK